MRVVTAKVPAILVLVCGLLLSVPAIALAQETIVVHDRIHGEQDVVFWTEGRWANDFGPTLCTTFPGGIETNSGSTDFADSSECTSLPNSWDWEVVLPGDRRLEWSVNGIPVGVEVCAHIFYDSESATIEVSVDLDSDHMRVGRPGEEPIYDGSFSGFDPGMSGFQITEIERCGHIAVREPPVPVASHTWGKIKSLYQ